MITEKNIEAFWNRVKKTDAHWLWTGSKTIAGYGKLRINSKEQYAARISYAIANDKKLEDIIHLRIINLCGENSCVNPSHLFGKPNKH